MLRTLLPCILLALVPWTLRAQCTESNETKVLLVGDSWAFFMGVDQTINEVLNKWGHSHYTYYTNLTLAENGAETDDFQTAAKQDEIQARIDANPSIEVVHLSIGGNDVLGDWHVSFTQEQTDSLKDAVEERLLEVIDFVKSTRPGMRVLYSGYMYPNFEEVIEELGVLQTIHPFYGTWEGMGFPTAIQLNTILNDLSADLETYADSDPQVDFVSATGLMQFAYGQNTPLGVPPGGSYPPLAAPLPAGFTDYPSPMNSMRNYGLFLDCFHLSAGGYRNMVERQTQKFYHKFLMSDQYLLSGGGLEDGTVSSNGGVTALLQLGEQGGEQFSTLLTFHTDAMEEGSVEAASLFLRRDDLSGTNPISGTVQVKVKSGHFGASVEVEATDLTSNADAAGTACRFGSNGGNGHWIRLDLPSALLPWITMDNTTQFIISAPDAMGGVVTFSDATDLEFGPVLDLTFGELTVGSVDVDGNSATLLAYPNPTDGMLTIGSLQTLVLSFELRDPLGRLVLQGPAPQNTLDLGGLPSGSYILTLVTHEGRTTRRVVKW